MWFKGGILPFLLTKCFIGAAKGSISGCFWLSPAAMFSLCTDSAADYSAIGCFCVYYFSIDEFRSLLSVCDYEARASIVLTCDRIDLCSPSMAFSMALWWLCLEPSHFATSASSRSSFFTSLLLTTLRVLFREWDLAGSRFYASNDELDSWWPELLGNVLP